MSYRQTRLDFEYLNSLIEINDTVDQMSELQLFMENPTKKFAADLYHSMIFQWFIERGSRLMHCGKRIGSYKCDAKTKRIAKRYNLDIAYLEKKS